MSRVVTMQYIRKPLYVAAVRITGNNFEEISEWCQGDIQQDETPGEGTGKKFIRVRVHNPKTPRQTKAFVGDWILYTERGYKVYTNKAFHASFDPVSTNGGVPSNGSEEVLLGSEELIPGLTINEAIAMVKDGRLQFARITQPSPAESSPGPQEKAT